MHGPDYPPPPLVRLSYVTRLFVNSVLSSISCIVAVTRIIVDYTYCLLAMQSSIDVILIYM